MVAEKTPSQKRPLSPVRIALVVLLLAGLLGTAHSMWLMGPLDAGLKKALAAGREGAVTPHGILDLEFAFSRDNAKKIVTTWRTEQDDQGGRLLALAEESLLRDRELIASYFVALTALCLLVGAAFSGDRRKAWNQITLLPTQAALLDVLENLLLAKQLDGSYELALWASLVATAKFTLLAATAVALIIVGLAWLGKRFSAPHTRTATSFATVVEAEKRYLDQRREKADLPPRDHQLGLALSGGGIRSATLNLGVLQALARRRVLPRFDYLSTVSGGGYIGAALSSLLSINRSRISAAPAGGEGQYVFAGGVDKKDESWFSTDHDRFPFNEGNEETMRESGQGFGGGAQMRHLRAAASSWLGRSQLFSIEMARAVGSVLMGVVFHLLHFGLFLVAASAGYLYGVYLMVGDRATEAGAGQAAASNLIGGLLTEPTSLLDQYRGFVRQAFGLARDLSWEHPFVVAAITGFVTMALTLALAQWLLPRLPDDWFARSGFTRARSRNFVSVLALVATMMLVGFGVLTPWYVTEFPDNLLNISIPLFTWLGGGVCLGFFHGCVKSSRRFRHAHRSRLAAQEGAFVYATLISLILVLLMLPFLVFFDPLVDYLSDRPIRSLFGWVLTLLGARLFAGGEQKAAGEGALGRLLSWAPGLRKVLLSAVVAAAVLGGFLLICVYIWRREPKDDPETFRLVVCLAALALYLLTGLINFNRLSLHFFYRDRLAEAYLRTTEADPTANNSLKALRENEGLRLEHLHGRRRRGGPEECVTAAPYHLVVSCLNLSADTSPKQATRKTDQFIFSRLYSGSETTGFLETARYRAGETKLADAMTISGAAASPAMGSQTFFAQSAAMTLFNVRLGRWMENPAYKRGTLPRWTFWPWYLLQEILASCDAAKRLVYLSDGGHSGDNLGIYPLLKRRCRLILAVDAEHDPTYSGNSLVEALRQIRIDEGITVDIDLRPLRPGKQTGKSTAHYVSGKIDYPRQEIETADGAKVIEASTGWLIVIKSSLTGDEPEMIANYKRGSEPFPHETTADLFFDDAQFEAYRQLGEHMVDTMLDTSPVCRTELRAASTPA